MIFWGLHFTKLHFGLLAFSSTLVCFWLAFIWWLGQHLCLQHNVASTGSHDWHGSQYGSHDLQHGLHGSLAHRLVRLLKHSLK